MKKENYESDEEEAEAEEEDDEEEPAPKKSLYKKKPKQQPMTVITENQLINMKLDEILKKLAEFG